MEILFQTIFVENVLSQPILVESSVELVKLALFSLVFSAVSHVAH